MKVSILLLLSGAFAPPPTGVRFSDAPIVWTDPDKAPIDRPEEYWSSLYWDGGDKIFFRPITRALLFETSGPAANINALGEVPDSSWFTNRMSVRTLSTAEAAAGPCVGPGPTPGGPWIALSGKLNGTNPGFLMKDAATGDRYLLKFNNSGEPNEQPTSGDVIGSKIYWAAGYSTPCNRIVHIDPSWIQAGEKATKKNDRGGKMPLTADDIVDAMKGAAKTADGMVIGSASLLFEGKPLGPLTYVGTRSDDPNDVVNHEDRRDLRGARLLAAWVNHWDAREQNSFSTFIKTEGERGYVAHHFLDWGDVLGSPWDWDERRMGLSGYLDFGDIGLDLITLGLLERPWDRVTMAPGASKNFGTFNVADFEPAEWKIAYPNPAFSRMDDADAYWMAKIISRFSDAHVQAIVAEAKLTQSEATDYLVQTLIARRDKILHEYLNRISSLERPHTRGTEVCLEDIMVTRGFDPAANATYQVRIDNGDWRLPERVADGWVCVETGAAASRDYVVVHARVRRIHQREAAAPVAFHFVVRGEAGLSLVGIERGR